MVNSTSGLMSSRSPSSRCTANTSAKNSALRTRLRSASSELVDNSRRGIGTVLHLPTRPALATTQPLRPTLRQASTVNPYYPQNQRVMRHPHSSGRQQLSHDSDLPAERRRLAWVLGGTGGRGGEEPRYRFAG